MCVSVCASVCASVCIPLCVCASVCVNRQVLPTGSLVSDMTLWVTASAEIVLVVANAAGSNGDIFTPIPVDRLGTEYYAAAGNKMEDVTASFITVSAPYDDTVVNITLPARASASESVTLQGVKYYPNDVITVTLNRLQTLQLQVM